MTVSQNSNTKLREVAEAVIATTSRQEPLPQKFQEHPATALAAGRQTRMYGACFTSATSKRPNRWNPVSPTAPQGLEGRCVDSDAPFDETGPHAIQNSRSLGHRTRRAPMVNAPHALAAGNVEHTYAAPEISEEGDHVTWQWTVTNTGDQIAHKVVMTHKITPNVAVTSLPVQCAPSGETIRCDYVALAPGEEAEGSPEPDLPQDASEAVRISGRVTWEPGRSCPHWHPRPTTLIDSHTGMPTAG